MTKKLGDTEEQIEALEADAEAAEAADKDSSALLLDAMTNLIRKGEIVDSGERRNGQIVWIRKVIN